MGCLFNYGDEYKTQQLESYSVEGLIKALNKELEETSKDFEFIQQKMANINQAIEKLKS